MKFTNFWRTLFVSMMAVSAFVACSDNDDDDYSGIPEVTVNGTSEATVYRDLTEGATEAVSIVSNAPWTLKFEAESAATWCTPNVWQGGAGTTALTFNCSALQSGEREAVAVVTAAGQMMGYPVTSVVKIKIHQTGAGETVVIYNTTVGNGDASSNPFANAYTDWNATGTGAAGVTYAIDGKVSVRSSGLSSAGAYEGASGPNVVFFGTAPTAFMIQKIALTSEQTDLKLTFGASSSVRNEADGSYDNAFDTSKFIVALSADGATWTNIEYTTNGGDQASPYWIFATSNFTLKEAVSDLYIRFSASVSSAIRLDDITLSTGVGGTVVDLGEGGGETPTPGEAIQTTIAELVAKIEPQTTATVLDANNDYVFTGVVMNNKEVGNYAKLNLYLAAEGATAAKNGLVLYGDAVESALTTYAQGARVKVTLKKGLAKIQNRYGVFQVSGDKGSAYCTIEADGTAAVNPVTITADKIADYQGMYVQIEGTTSASGVWYNGTSNTTTTLTTANGNLLVFVNTAAGATFTLPYAAKTAVVKGIAMVYGNATSQTAELIPQSADDVAAFTPSTSEPTITAVDPASLSWSADETGMRSVAVTGVDLAGNLTAEVDNTAAFTAVVNGTTVEVTPAGANTTDADITATLTLKAGSSTKTVALKQSKPAGQGGDNDKEYTMITSVSELTAGEYLIGGFGTSAKTLFLYTSGVTKGNGFTAAYTYDEKTGALSTTNSYTAVPVCLEAVDGGFKFFDTKAAKYIVVTKAGSGSVALQDASDDYFKLSAASGVIKQDIRAESNKVANAGLIISISATSNVLRSWNLAGSNDANGLVFFKKN